MEAEGKAKNSKAAQYILMFALFAAALICIGEMLRFMGVNRGYYQVYDIRDGWDVDYCGKQYTDISRLDKRLTRTPTKKNDVLTMTRTIDIDTPERLTLRVYSRLSAVRVSVIEPGGAEKVIYFYGYDTDSLHTGEFLGSGYHFVPLPNDCYGKTLKIMEMGSEDGALTGLPDAVITESTDAMEAFAQTRMFAAFATVFMFLAGCLIVLLSLFVAVFDRDFFRLTLLGAFSISGSLWCLCSSKSMELFSRNIQLNSYIEYISLYIMIIPMIALVLTCFKYIPVWQKAVLFGTMCLAIVLVFAAFYLQKARIANIDFILPIYHALLAFASLFMILVSVLYWKKSRIAERLFEAGIFVAAAAGLIYMLIYYVTDRASLDSSALDLVYVPGAFLLMSIFIFIGYISDLYARKGEETQRRRLDTTAGMDDLTGLRSYIIGESEMRKLDTDGGDYLFLSLDLNGLNGVNRQHGNSAGDLYIKTFAKIIKECFKDADLICRMGGDEFLIIYETAIPTAPDIDKRLYQMESMEKEAADALSVPIHIEASFGYAFSTEVRGRNCKRAYQLADRRMYRMKMNMKDRRAD